VQGLPGPHGEKGETGDVGQMVQFHIYKTILVKCTFTLIESTSLLC